MLRSVLFTLCITVIFGSSLALAEVHQVHSCAGSHDPLSESSLSRSSLNHSLSGGTMSVESQPRHYSSSRSTFRPDNVHTLWKSGEPSNRLDIVVLGDGYSASEQEKFAADTQRIIDRIFQEEPFRSYQNLINVHRVDLASSDSGVDNDPVVGVDKSTALHSLFHCNGVERALCVDVAATKAAASVAPEVDQIVVVANSSKYGGVAYFSDNIATLSGSNANSLELFLHEFAHSFGKLADEYVTRGEYHGSEFSRVNVSVQTAEQMAVSLSKWHAWIGHEDGSLGTISTFEGAWNYGSGAFRPTEDSKMRSLGRPFNAPSVEGLILELYKYVSPIDSFSDNSKIVDTARVLFVKPVQPLREGLDIQWFLEGRLIEVEGAYLDLSSLNLKVGQSYLVKAEVQDRTALVRNETARLNVMSKSIEWNVQLSSATSENDSDDDGVSNTQELVEGTNPQDAGSFKSSLDSYACTLPNAYLGQINIASISNKGSSLLHGAASYRNAQGVEKSTVRFTLEPSEKLDFIVNDMGLESDTFGSFCIKTQGSAWSGGLVIYKPSVQSGLNFSQNDFDYALYYPFEEAVTGISSVSLNTHFVGAGERGLVANWLRIADADISDSRNLSGVFRVYDHAGEILFEQEVSIANGGRVDISGHDILGSSSVGLASFTPYDPSQGYYFEATRYFYSNSNIAEPSFYAAVAIPRAESSFSQKHSILTQDTNSFSVLELVNASSEVSQSSILVKDAEGREVLSRSVSQSPFSSMHQVVSAGELSGATRGSASLESALGSTATTTLVYSFNTDGTLASVQSNAVSHAASKIQYGEFNTFIGHENTFQVLNVSSETVNAYVDVVGEGKRVLYSTRVTLGAGHLIEIAPILPKDTYGTVRVQSGLDNRLVVKTIISKAGQYSLPILAR